MPLADHGQDGNDCKFGTPSPLFRCRSCMQQHQCISACARPTPPATPILSYKHTSSTSQTLVAWCSVRRQDFPLLWLKEPGTPVLGFHGPHQRKCRYVCNTNKPTVTLRDT